MQYDEPVAIKVSGDLACFTRPEMKVERVSYPVMTPTAALGLLANILWKPEFTWQITEIAVLCPINYHSIARNEVKNRASHRAAQGWAKTGEGGYVVEEDHTPRHTLALRDVSYVIRALPVPHDPSIDAAKYRDQFRRRVRKGQCFGVPYLGCREFVAEFEEPTGNERAISLDLDLGRMLLAFDDKPDLPGIRTPRFFEARLEAGVLRVPEGAT
ncbi:MAG: type I-C CRISPR-associated protein Cas5c [Thermomicrobiales bacterium]